MDMLFICRDALASSLISNLLLAIEAKRAGVDVGVVFTQEALQAVAGGNFNWPSELTGQETRYKVTDNAAAMGLNLPTMGGRGEGRQIDVPKIIPMAKEAGVPMFACPLWEGLLGLKGKLPEGVKEMDVAAILSALREAKTIIGSL
jgi:predicted peroxiredoxin